MAFRICKMIWLLISLKSTTVIGLAASEYTLNTCYSFDDLDDTLKEKLEMYGEISNLGLYQYTSIEPKILSNFVTCVAEDVTRVLSELEVNDEGIYNATLDVDTDLSDLATKVEDSLSDVLTEDGILSRVEFVEVNFDHSNTSPTTVWNVELVVKGRSSTVETDMKEEIKSLTERTADDSSTYYELINVGEIDAEKLSFTTLTCAGNPPDAPQNGGRDWNDEKYPGTTAWYSCNTGYFLSDDSKAYSTCQHEDLKWSTPEISLTCVKGCTDQPPINPPFFTEKEEWSIEMRNEGDVATYVCMDGYRPIREEKATSTCENSQWTAIDSDEFECELIECEIHIPQVPAHGRTDWDEKTVRPYTIITYSCMDGYTQTVDEVSVICDAEGNWTMLDPSFECINNELAKEMGIYDDQRIAEYDYYEYARTNLGKEVPAYENLFWITVYSFSGVVLMVLVVLCMTRTDSPIYIICTGTSKKTSYIPPK